MARGGREGKMGERGGGGGEGALKSGHQNRDNKTEREERVVGPLASLSTSFLLLWCKVLVVDASSWKCAVPPPPRLPHSLSSSASFLLQFLLLVAFLADV